MDFSQLAAVAASLSVPHTNNYWEAEVIATIQNRFGTFDFTEDQILTLKPGLVGFPEYGRFALAPLEAGKDFRLLQSLDEASLAFIVYPTTVATALLDVVEVNALCAEYHIRKEDLVLLHIATLRAGQGITLNQKAPIVVNAFRQTGTQHVLASNKYTTQFSFKGTEVAA